MSTKQKRLTVYRDDGSVSCNFDEPCMEKYDDCFECPHMLAMREKLAAYEWAEEVGLLGILTRQFLQQDGTAYAKQRNTV